MGEILSYFYQKFIKALIGSKISTLKASESGVSEVLILENKLSVLSVRMGEMV